MENENYNNEQRIESGLDNFQKAKFVLAAALVINGLIPKEVKPAEATKETPPITEYSKTSLTPSYSVEIPNVFTIPERDPNLRCISEDFLPIELAEFPEEEVLESFDLKNLDLESFTNYELDSVEDLPVGKVVETLGNTPLYIVPTNEDESIVTDRNLKQIMVPEGMNFEIAQKRIIKNARGEKVEIGVIRNTFGNSFYVAAIPLRFLSSDDEISFTKENRDMNRSVSYITTDDDIYPNKVMNILLGLTNVSKFQDKIGQFKVGELYSFLSMSGLRGYDTLHEYKLGYNSAKRKLLAGGVCASATGVSSLMHLIEGSKVNHFGHPVMYTQGPFSPSANDVDAAVSIERYADGEIKEYDLLFSPGKDGYIQIDVSLFPTDVKYEDTNEDGVGGLSDSVLVFSLSYSDNKPVLQTTNLLNSFNKYESYRESKHEIPLEYGNTDTMKRYKMDNTMEKVANLIYTSTK